MPLHGKIVVIKRSGGDGTEFPLTASCLFGRKPDCDIRIQLPQVSKEHCRIDLNENKEVILTNLSSVNPTRINGMIMQQTERLKHGDLITIIDRSFRFEYPPEPTPKKRRPSVGKSETLQVLHDQQTRDSESTHLKDAANTGNVQSCTVQDEDKAKTVLNSGLEQSKSNDKESLSPFCELYQMIKQNLNVKSPWKPSEGVQPKTPSSRNETPKTVCAKMAAGAVDNDEPFLPQDAKESPFKKMEGKRKSSGGFSGEATPKSAQKSGKARSVEMPVIQSAPEQPAEKQLEDTSQPAGTPGKETPRKNRRSLQSPADQSETPSVPEEKRTPVSQKKCRQGTPQKFSAGEVAHQIVSENSVKEEPCQGTEKTKSPKRRRSRECGSAALVSPANPDHLRVNQSQSEEVAEISNIQTEMTPKNKAASPQRVSPRTVKKLQAPNVLLELGLAAPPSGEEGNRPSSSRKRKSVELESELPAPQFKRKRVSFGGQLSPELFDKRLPPNSPLRRGATPGRRSLSLLKQQSVLRRASTIGLIRELNAEVSSPRRQKGQGSPGKKASPKRVSSVSKTPSPAKRSPKSKAKTPSPQKAEARSSPAAKSPARVKTPSSARQSSSTEEPIMPKGKKSLTPSPAPSMGETPVRVQSSCTPLAKKSPMASGKTPLDEEESVDKSEVPSTPVANRRGRSSTSASPVQSTAEASKTQSPAGAASSSDAKTPSSRGVSSNDSSTSQTPTVRGRFSISRIDTPSPVADQDASAVEGSTSVTSACVTPAVPLRRTSMKSASKKTPKSARKSVLEVIRSRRSGASRANLKVVSSWADIVKFGVTKPQAGGVPAKKGTAKRKAIKKAVMQKPKTPARKIKEHFSTGHAASPATIVVGKAHTKVALTAGFAPKLVHNVALLKKNMEVNEDLTGITELFSTPVNDGEKRTPSSGRYCPETPQPLKSLSEVSVMDTPEETGEMVVSPLTVASTAKQGRYNSDAVVRLLQEDGDTSFISDTPKANLGVLTTPGTPQPEDAEQCPDKKKGLRTPKQKPQALCLTGVKRLMRTPKQKPQQVEDLRGLKRLLKTPKEPKASQEVSLVGVKEMLKTPKHKGQPVEDMAGVQRVMRTPRVKKTPQVCVTGVKRLMRTPKQKAEPVEDMVGVKRLMQTPKQKAEPVEDMVGVKRLMQTPKQKAEPVEDMVGVKRLMQTPKQKGQPVENNFGISRLMKSPRERGAAAVEDFTGLQELMKEPLDDALPEADVMKECKTSEEKVSENPCSPECGKSVPALEAEMVSEEGSTKSMHEENQGNSKRSVRGRPRKQGKIVTDTPADGQLTDSQCEEEISSTGDVDNSLPELKPKRGRRACPAPASPVKRVRQRITEIKEEEIKPAAAVPAKSTRGKRAKNLKESEQSDSEENAGESVKLPELEKACDDVKSMDVENAQQTAPVQVAARGRRGKRTETPQKVPAAAPVRKTGRGRVAKGKEGVSGNDTIKVEPVEVPPTPTKAEDIEQQVSVSPAPIVKPRRGRKPKQTEEAQVTPAEALGEVSTTDAKAGIENMPETEVKTPVKSGRGRKAKTVTKEDDQTSLEAPPKRRCPGNIEALTIQTVASPVPKSVRGRKSAKNVDSTEAIVVEAVASSTKCAAEPNRKTRGTRKAAMHSDAVAVSDIGPIDAKVEDSMPEITVSEGKPSRRGKVASQQKVVEEGSKNAAQQEETIVKDEVKKAPAKKTVNWSADLAVTCTSEAEALPHSLRTSQQSDLKNGDKSTVVSTGDAGALVEKEQPLGQQTKSRRGRPGKQSTVKLPESSVVEEHPDPEPALGKATRKGRTQVTKPVKSDDTPVAKRGIKRKAHEEVAEITGGDEQASESLNTGSLPKRTRGRMAKIEETKVEANASNRGKRGTAKKAERALENESEESDTKPKTETPKPVGRGRRKVAQEAETETKPTQETYPDKGEMEVVKNAETVTRGRGRPPKKDDGTSLTEPMPVRRTRRR